jgi:tripartite-type tricarboxylate transporter receptor subunit TctC
LKHIPYKGSAPAVTDLIGGQIPLMFDPIQSVLPHVLSGKLTALAVTSKTRSPLLPNVPTVAESGYPNFESTAWWAVFAPAKIPENVEKILTREVQKVASSAAFKERLGNVGVQPNTNFKESLSAFQTREIAKWAIAVRDSGASLD